MRKSTRGAFTLVELLVVITIIGMLMAMVFPALASFMERVRITQCQNRQGEIAKNIGLYESSKHKYPGYCTSILMTGTSQRGGPRSMQPALKSWYVAVLEMADKEKFDAIRSGSSAQPSELSLFNCPANARQGDLVGYVANCGREDAKGASGNTPPDWKANGVFMQEYVQFTSGMRQEKVSSGDIADGLNNTLLISENLQATRWTVHGEPDVGMVWYASSDPNTPPQDSMQINVQRDKEVTTGDYNFARPSSNHPGGVVVAYCDGSYEFLNDNVDYGSVYCKLMTPNGRECKEPGQNQPCAEFFRLPFDERLKNP